MSSEKLLGKNLTDAAGVSRIMILVKYLQNKKYIPADPFFKPAQLYKHD